MKPKLTIHTINSGSTGNCYVCVLPNNDFFLLDAGLPWTLIVQFVEKNLHLRMTRCKGIFISHSHIDHTMALEGETNLANKYSINVWVPDKNVRYKDVRPNLLHVLSGQVGKTVYPFGNVRFATMEVPHDAFNLGFKFKIKSTTSEISLLYVTDIGNVVTFPVFNDLFDVIMFEVNHELERTQKSTKITARRALSDTGHMNSRDALSYLTKLPATKNAHVLLIHMSGDHFDMQEDIHLFDTLECKTHSWATPGSKLEVL